MPSLNKDKYQVIYADPPWPSPGGFAPNESYASHYHYPCMRMSEIAGMGRRVQQCVADDAALFIWTTGRDLANCVSQIIPAWGFEYKTIGFNWLKTTTRGNPCKVMGYFFFSSTEICLFAVRGSPSRFSAGLAVKVDSLIVEERVRHSQKPVQAYERIERLFPGARKLELFARQPRDGWDSFGNEIEESIKLGG